MANLVGHLPDDLVQVIEVLGPGAHQLSAPEEQGGRLGVLKPEDQARECLGLVFRPVEIDRKRV